MAEEQRKNKNTSKHKSPLLVALYAPLFQPLEYQSITCQEGQITLVCACKSV